MNSIVCSILTLRGDNLETQASNTALLKGETLEAEQVFSRRISFNWSNFLIIWQAARTHDCFFCPWKSECLFLLRSIGTSKGRVTFVKIRTVTLQTEGCSLWKVLEASLFHFLLFLKDKWHFFFFFSSSMFPLVEFFLGETNSQNPLKREVACYSAVISLLGHQVSGFFRLTESSPGF